VIRLLLAASCSFRSPGLEVENCFNPIPWAISLCAVLADVLGLGIGGSRSAVRVENSESLKLQATSTVLHMICREKIERKRIITRLKLLPVPSIFAKRSSSSFSGRTLYLGGTQA
jgi:hypothetical protein